mgnify:CR=1 FL=1
MTAMCVVFVAENRQLEIAHHKKVREEVQGDILKMFARVDTVCTWVRLQQFSFPNDEGEEFLWRNALTAARCMMEMIPPVPDGSDAGVEEWRESSFWNV